MSLALTVLSSRGPLLARVASVVNAVAQRRLTRVLDWFEQNMNDNGHRSQYLYGHFRNALEAWIYADTGLLSRVVLCDAVP